jgi:putative ABC transport system permease protein
MDLFFVAGLSLVLGAIWLLVFNLELLSGLAGRAGARLRGGALLLRTSLAFPTHHRFRTGMTVAMFGLVIFGMVVASVLLTGTHRAYSDPDAMAGGFEIRIEQAAGDPPVRALVAEAQTVRPEDFAAIGTIQIAQAEAIQLGGEGARGWRALPIALVDDEFTRAVQSGFATRAHGYASDAAVWQALREQPGLAVIAGPAVRPRQAEALPGGLFRLDGVVKEDRAMPPLEVWVRDQRGGAATKVTVIGVLDPRATFGFGLFTSPETLRATGAPPPPRVVSYLRVRPGASAAEKALGLNLGLQERGVRATEIGEDVRRILGLRMLLNDLLQAFIGVGLLAGIVGLGIISTRAVVERRQQIGIMRALGFSRRAVQGSFLIEASIVALLGILVGTALGLGLSYRLVEYLGREFPEIAFSVPWGQIGGIALFAFVASMLTTFLPACQAGRISPAEALRYE